MGGGGGAGLCEEIFRSSVGGGERERLLVYGPLVLGDLSISLKCGPIKSSDNKHLCRKNISLHIILFFLKKNLF